MDQIISKNNLQEWLISFYSAGIDMPPQKVETIMTLCGSQLIKLHDFRKALRTALNVLLRAGVFASWTIDSSDLVHIILPAVVGNAVDPA